MLNIITFILLQFINWFQSWKHETCEWHTILKVKSIPCRVCLLNLLAGPTDEHFIVHISLNSQTWKQKNEHKNIKVEKSNTYRKQQSEKNCIWNKAIPNNFKETYLVAIIINSFSRWSMRWCWNLIQPGFPLTTCLIYRRKKIANSNNPDKLISA